ncbi:MAG TPA: hypothetical protein VLA34_00285, partial [Candidatus Krumholzibacterium sp.]|nr:hypothetical protein [Candidatus Krumholzibacterium sp.]
MAYKRFRSHFLLRILLLTATIFILVFLVSYRALYATVAISAIAIIIQIVSLMRFVEKTNRDFVRFLQSIEYSDFTQNFISGLKGRSFDELNEAFDKVISRFREISLQREESHRYLQTVVQHIGVGIVTFGPDG